MEKLLDMGNENVHDVPKKFEDTEYKEHEKTKKEINELRQDFNKHQSGTKDTIQREPYELMTQNIRVVE
jgi:hypothetical protein